MSKATQDKIDNKKLKIEALKKAKNIVEKPSYNAGICSALWHYNTCSYDIANQLTNYISRSLSGSNYLEGWLTRNLPANAKVYDNRKKVKATRLAWIDWMIACLQEDIDKLQAKLEK